MKKKFFGFLFALLLIIPFLTINAKEKSKVKVYVFEAGGCPYCEEEIKYLEGLDSYNKKFTIERRELYIDHVNWEEGRDYELGKAVAEKFQSEGFKDASYQGTPFVVISDIYASASYSTDLESYINDAYSTGDKDVVNKLAKELKLENVNRDDIGEGDGSSTTTSGNGAEEYSNEKPNVIVIFIAVLVLLGAIFIVIKHGGSEEIVEEIEEEKENKTSVNKTPRKKEQVKNASNKKGTVKKTTKPVKKVNKK